MNEGRTATATAATRVGSGAGRLIRAWRSLPHERRLAAYAAIGLFLSLFLPWYQRQFFVVIGGKIQPASDSQTAWGAFSFVEAAILLVAVGVLVLLFQRAEGKAFHLPGGDGGVITAAGVWSAVLIVWRIFDKQGGAAQGQAATTYGIEWGIFIALVIAIGLILAGSRIRAAHRPEPPLPGDDDASPVPGGPRAPAPPRLPVLEARIVAPESDQDATVKRASAAPPTPVPAMPRPAAASSPRKDDGHSRASEDEGRSRTSERESVEFVPDEPREFIPRRRPAEPAGTPRVPGERQRGWLTARPSHLAAKPPAPVPASPPDPPVPARADDVSVSADDPDATLPRSRREPPADDTAATLPAPRRKQPPDDQLTIPLEHDD